MRNASDQTITFPTTESRFIPIAFGTLVFLAGFAPSAIVACQWLFPSGKPSTEAGSILPGTAIALLGIKMMTDRERVTVDGGNRTIVWKRSSYGVVWRTRTCRFDEIEAIEAVRITGLNYSYYDFVLRGPRNKPLLFTQTKKSSPGVVRDTAALLNIPVEKV